MKKNNKKSKFKWIQLKQIRKTLGLFQSREHGRVDRNCLNIATARADSIDKHQQSTCK